MTEHERLIQDLESTMLALKNLSPNWRAEIYFCIKRVDAAGLELEGDQEQERKAG